MTVILFGLGINKYRFVLTTLISPEYDFVYLLIC